MCKERINTMSESLIDLVFSEEETLSDESPDAALEVAAGNCWAQAGNPFTFAFCTGLDTCSRRCMLSGGGQWSTAEARN